MTLLFKLSVFAAILNAVFACFGLPGIAPATGQPGAPGTGLLITEEDIIAQEAEIERLKMRQRILRKRFRECKTCETEARRKVIRASRCRALLCNFENGNMCNWRTNGRPGIPPDMLEIFLAENPDFEAMMKKQRAKDLDAIANEGVWAEVLAEDGMLTDAKRAMLSTLTPSEIQALTTGKMTPAAATALQAKLAQAYAEHRKNVAAVSGDLAELGRSFGDSRRAKRQAFLEEETTIMPVTLSPGEKQAEILAKQLEAEGEIPKGGQQDIVKSDKTWAAIHERFGTAITGVGTTPNGHYWATTYVMPGDVAVMQVEVYFSDDSYYLYFDAYESTPYVQMRMCCDGTDRCTARTKWTGDGSPPSWKRISGLCPIGTRKIQFVCQNIGPNHGACGLDNIRVYSKDGVNYCEGIDLLLAVEGAGPTVPPVIASPETLKEAQDLLLRLQQVAPTVAPAPLRQLRQRHRQQRQKLQRQKLRRQKLQRRRARKRKQKH